MYQALNDHNFSEYSHQHCKASSTPSYRQGNCSPHKLSDSHKFKKVGNRQLKPGQSGSRIHGLFMLWDHVHRYGLTFPLNGHA